MIAIVLLSVQAVHLVRNTHVLDWLVVLLVLER